MIHKVLSSFFYTCVIYLEVIFTTIALSLSAITFLSPLLLSLLFPPFKVWNNEREFRSCLTFSLNISPGSQMLLTQHPERKGKKPNKGIFLSGYLLSLVEKKKTKHDYQHQQVTEVNCPFLCFSLHVHCINTSAITLYGHILFHSRGVSWLY